jgi:pimeloyl-ACP methyl ester carboxylesterase
VADDWSVLFEPLARAGHRLVAFDNRGSGKSSVPPGPYTTTQMAEDSIALLDHLGLEGVDVFGMSMGGMIAQELAINAPQRVRRLALGCTHAGVAHAAPPSREAGRAFALQTDDWALRMRTLAPHAFATHVDPALLQAFVAKKSGDVQDPSGYRAQIEAVLAHDTADRLDRIRAPTLVLTGDDERIIPGDSSRLLAQRIPDARLETMLGAGHLFFIEQPGETLCRLLPFLGG